MSIPVFQQLVNIQVGLGLEYRWFWNFGKLQSFRSSSPISVPQETSQSNIGVKRYGQNANTNQNISMPGLFPSLA